MASLRSTGTLALVGTLLAVGLAPSASGHKGSSGPTVITGSASVVGEYNEFNGTVNPHGLPTEYWFEYGETNGYGDPSQRESITNPAVLSEPNKVTLKLKAGTAALPLLKGNWRYRIVAKNAEGETKGHEHIFSLKGASGKKKKGTKSAIALSQPEPVLAGEALVLSGTVTGSERANREVVLEASPYPYRAAFADVGAPVRTNSAGDFTFRVPHLSTSTRFHVVTAGPPLLPASHTVTGLAAVRVVLKVRRDSRAKGIVRLYGTVSPAEVGAHMYFQVEQPPKPKLPSAKPERRGKKSEGEKEQAPRFATKFSTRVKRGTATVSRFSIVVTITDSGLYRAFVVLPPGPIASGYSGTIGLHAAFSPRKKKKK